MDLSNFLNPWTLKCLLIFSLALLVVAFKKPIQSNKINLFSLFFLIAVIYTLSYLGPITYLFHYYSRMPYFSRFSGWLFLLLPVILFPLIIAWCGKKNLSQLKTYLVSSISVLFLVPFTTQLVKSFIMFFEFPPSFPLPVLHLYYFIDGSGVFGLSLLMTFLINKFILKETSEKRRYFLMTVPVQVLIAVLIILNPTRIIVWKIDSTLGVPGYSGEGELYATWKFLWMINYCLPLYFWFSRPKAQEQKGS